MGNRGDGRGQPHKGPRDQFITRPTEAVGKRVRQEAEEKNLPYGTVIANILADHYGLPATNVTAIAGPRQELLELLTG